VKVGFHFDADHESVRLNYGGAIEAEFFNALASLNSPGLSTKMYVGDLRLTSLAMVRKQTGSVTEETFDENKYLDGFAGWLAPVLIGWARIPLENMLRCIHRNIFVIYLDTASPQTAGCLSRRLEGLPCYLGALEVDERFPEHRVLYMGSLLPLCRIAESKVSLFREGFEGEDLDMVRVEQCERAGFTDVSYEVFSEIVFTD
jgi:hypothetical protein